MSGSRLPDRLRRYVERNVTTDAPPPTVVRLTQEGEMQLRPNLWLTFRAIQELHVERVAFAWTARFPIAPLIWLRVTDWYGDGDGALSGRLWSPRSRHGLEVR